ncbi:MAG: PDZ domain-containing protein [Planctomycetota bacterium]
MQRTRRKSPLMISAAISALMIAHGSALAQENMLPTKPADGEMKVHRLKRPNTGKVQVGGQIGSVAVDFGQMKKKGRRLEDVRLDPALVAIAQQLDAPDFATRERAMDQILNGVGDSMEIEKILDHGEVTNEQRVRLIEVAREFLLTQPRGALGISMDPRRIGADNLPEIRVIDLLPDLPAADVLQIGDRITHMDGNRLTNNSDLISYVQYRRPGQTIQLTVKRPRLDDAQEQLEVLDDGRVDFDELEITLELGDADKLNNAGATAESQVQRERRLRAQGIKRQYGIRVVPADIDTAYVAGVIYTPQRIFDVEVLDMSPEIQALKRQQELIRDGQMELTPQVQRMWSVHLGRLRDLSIHPDLNEFDRLYHEKVADRYEDLMGNRPD